MGKSDSLLFPLYSSFLDDIEYDSVAFLGFSNENDFTRGISGSTRHFYDLQLGNWDINDRWTLAQNYDLIVCTRCAYFAKDPHDFIERCKRHLTESGHALIDWGLGDHWRFSMFKVGWARNGEHEYAYNAQNFLHSCFWRPSLSQLEEVKSFWRSAACVGNYETNCSLESVLLKEVPSLIDYRTKRLAVKFLWPDSPQLYIVTLVEKES